MNEQVKWYIEQALNEFGFEGVDKRLTTVDEIVERPYIYGDVIYKALELAVRDVG